MPTFKTTKAFVAFGPEINAPIVWVQKDVLVTPVHEDIFSSDYKVVNTGEVFQIQHSTAFLFLEELKMTGKDEYTPSWMPEATFKFAYTHGEKATLESPSFPDEIEIYEVLIHS